jgi:hypothetical protein
MACHEEGLASCVGSGLTIQWKVSVEGGEAPAFRGGAEAEAVAEAEAEAEESPNAPSASICAILARISAIDGMVWRRCGGGVAPCVRPEKTVETG